MTPEEKQKIIDQTIEICNNAIKELDEMKHGVNFLVNEYYTNKRYFCEEGLPTIEDVIKTAFEFGWSSKHIFENNQSLKH